MSITSKGLKMKWPNRFLRGITMESGNRNWIRGKAGAISTKGAMRLGNLEVFEVRICGKVEVHRSREIDAQGMERWYKNAD
jgi:hypothetical protein